MHVGSLQMRTTSIDDHLSKRLVVGVGKSVEHIGCSIVLALFARRDHPQGRVALLPIHMIHSMVVLESRRPRKNDRRAAKGNL